MPKKRAVSLRFSKTKGAGVERSKEQGEEATAK